MSRPKQYTDGSVEFYKLKFKVDERALIPRPETELLVDDVLSYIKHSIIHNSQFIILDIGTGSGNIAISIAKNLPTSDVRIIATDVSEEALEVARLNAKYHGVEDKIEFTKSDLLNNVTLNSFQGLEMPKQVRHDNCIIVTNLPYIPSARISYLDSSVKDFEPHVALDGGSDGFGLYRKLFQQISNLQLPISLLLGEIDYTHGEIAKLEGEKYFPNHQVSVKTDLAHKQRILRISTQPKG